MNFVNLFRSFSLWSATVAFMLPLPAMATDKPTDTNTNHEISTDHDANWLPPSIEYQIQNGDTLSTIFSKLDIGYSTMLAVMEGDVSFLALDTLQPDDTLRFWIDEANHDLMTMEIEFNLAEKAQYHRQSDNTYVYQDVSQEGEWKQEAVVGEIHGSFSISADRAGLTRSQIGQIAHLLKGKVNFSRDLHAGDEFAVVRNKQFVDGQFTGNSEIHAIVIRRGSRNIEAYLHSDGQYYDGDGDSLQQAFLRLPIAKRYRITSKFNPRRKHPVTGRIRPHNGTDFGTPIGTPVVSTGDGTVIMTRNHPYAGKYVVIDHGSSYKTRYLHLNRILVKKGQKVSRGQRIALSGNTGRSTGPHLHFELLIKNRPVNAMTAKIPMASSVSKNESAVFLANKVKLNQLIEQQKIVIAEKKKNASNTPSI